MNFDIDKMYRATEAAKLMRGDKCSVKSSGEDSKKLISYISWSVFITQIWKEKKRQKDMSLLESSHFSGQISSLCA